MVTRALVDQWLNANETRDLEFKEAKNTYKFDKLCEYCVAIANEGGGYFVLGVTDTCPRTIVGTQAFLDSSVEKKLLDKLGFSVQQHTINYNGERIVAFQIPSRPSGSPYEFNGRYLMRSGESLVAMTPDRLRDIINEDKPDWLFEPTGLSLDADELMAAIDTPRLFELLDRPYPSTQGEIIGVMVDLGLLDNIETPYQLRNITPLLLARKLSDFPAIALKAPRIIRYEGVDKLRVRIGYEADEGYAVCFKKMVGYVSAQMPQNQDISSVIRTTQKLVPDEIVRELFANALIHQDFSVTGYAPRLEIFDNRIVVSNAGKPVINPNRFIDRNQSRNERLANIMRKLRICEEIGSGFDLVISMSELMQLAPPEIRSSADQIHITIKGRSDFSGLSPTERVEACYQHACLKYVLSEQMTNKTLRDRFNLPPNKISSVSGVISQTSEDNLIKPSAANQARKNSSYVPFWA